MSTSPQIVPSSGSAEPICVLQCLTECTTCNHLRHINTRLADAEQLVHDLKNQRTILQSAVIQQNDPVTGGLPPEISTHIFELYVDAHKEEKRHYHDVWEVDEVPAGVPLRLGAVCRAWRSIAWSSPSLWTTLEINLVAENGHAHGPQLVRQWLQRTGSLPVNVRLVQPNRAKLGLDDDSAKEDAKSVMGVLNDFFSQIISIDLYWIPFDVASLLRKPQAGFTPILQHLTVGDLEDRELLESVDDPNMRLFDGYNPPPSPRHLWLRSSIPPERLNILWTSLTNLSIEYVSRAITFQIIRLSAHSLEDVSLRQINGYERDDDDWLPSHIVDLPALVSLSYTNMDSSEGTAKLLFDAHGFPALESLCYYGDTYDDHVMPVLSMVLCIQRSSCCLDELVIDGPEIQDAAELIPLLREAPELTSLNVSLGSSLSLEPLLQQLRPVYGGHNQQILLPNLCELNLTAYPTFSWTSFAKIWLPDGSFDINDHFLFTNYSIHSDRKKLVASMHVQDEEGHAYYVTAQAILALIATIPQVAGLSITQVGVKYVRDATPCSIPNLLEASFLHHFPIDNNPSHLTMYNLAKDVRIF